MKNKILISFIGLIFNCNSPKDGATLYLNRSNVETKRAVFEYPEDCRLIANNMNRNEPLVDWYCK